ncbi:MAG: GGDEF domain-containing protein [Planctomycetota bacterium]
MSTGQTLPLVNAGVIGLLAIVTAAAAASFAWQGRLTRHAARTAALTRQALDRDSRSDAGVAKRARYAVLAETHRELAENAEALSHKAMLAMASVAALPVVTAAGSVGLMVLIRRRIARPIRLMLEATERIADGELDHRVDYEASDEMGRLAVSFNRMARCLRRSLNELERQKARLEQRVAEATAELRGLSRTDELTGLPNLRHLRDAFDSLAQRARDAGSPLTLAAVGIENFRSFNDRFGYDAGNLLLVAFARIVRGAAREVDVVARGNGVQFIILMPGLEELPEPLVEQVDASLASLRKLVLHRTGRGVDVTVSFGAARFRSDGDDLDALLEEADRRMAAQWVPGAPAGGGKPTEGDGLAATATTATGASEEPS